MEGLLVCWLDYVRVGNDSAGVIVSGSDGSQCRRWGLRMGMGMGGVAMG